MSLSLRASNLLARAARRLREVPSLHHEVSASLAAECEAMAAELHAAHEAQGATIPSPPPARDTQPAPPSLVGWDALADQGEG